MAFCGNHECERYSDAVKLLAATSYCVVGTSVISNMHTCIVVSLVSYVEEHLLCSFFPPFHRPPWPTTTVEQYLLVYVLNSTFFREYRRRWQATGVYANSTKQLLIIVQCSNSKSYSSVRNSRVGLDFHKYSVGFANAAKYPIFDDFYLR